MSLIGYCIFLFELFLVPFRELFFDSFMGAVFLFVLAVFPFLMLCRVFRRF